MEEEGYSDVDPYEDPFYPETERVHHTTTRSGRKVYAPQRLVVDPYVSHELDGSDEEMSIPEEDDEGDDDGSVVLDEEDDGEGSYVPSDEEDESEDSDTETEDEEDGLFTPVNTPTEDYSPRESNGDYEQHYEHNGDRPHAG